MLTAGEESPLNGGFANGVAVFDVHGRIQYGINHCLFRDNTWTMVNYTGYLCYAFSHRDSARYNTYLREKVGV